MHSTCLWNRVPWQNPAAASTALGALHAPHVTCQPWPCPTMLGPAPAFPRPHHTPDPWSLCSSSTKESPHGFPFIFTGLSSLLRLQESCFSPFRVKAKAPGGGAWCCRHRHTSWTLHGATLWFLHCYCHL